MLARTMLTPPQLQYCDARPYAAIRTRLRRADQVAALAPLMWAEVRSWLAFEGRLEAGLTIFSPLHLMPTKGSGRIAMGLLPEGEYATLLHTGPYDELASARSALEDWGRAQGVKGLRAQADPAGELLEFYLRDQETEVALHVPSIPEGL